MRRSTASMVVQAGVSKSALVYIVGWRKMKIERLWLKRYQRLLIRWSKRADMYLAMLQFARGLIAWHHVYRDMLLVQMFY